MWIIFQIIVLFTLQFAPILCSKDTLHQLGTKDIMDNDKTKSLINELEEIKYKLSDKEEYSDMESGLDGDEIALDEHERFLKFL